MGEKQKRRGGEHRGAGAAAGPAAGPAAVGHQECPLPQARPGGGFEIVLEAAGHPGLCSCSSQYLS